MLVLTLLSTAEHQILPAIFQDRTHSIPGRLTVITIAILLVCAISLAMLWVRRRSILDYWLMLVIGALMSEQVLVGALSSARFSLGFYAGRIYSLATSIFVLGFLLAETTRLYARLARTNMMLERERDNKLMNVEAITSAIGHELRQPLAAIVSNASAALRFLSREPPDYEEARAGLNRVIKDGNRTSEVFDAVRALFRKVDHTKRPVEVNEIVGEVLASLQGDLNDGNIVVRFAPAQDLPLVEGNRRQLEEVILNLARNAIEAMAGTTNRARRLTVTTERQGHDAIAVGIQDSGPGIEPNHLEGLFSALITTKSHGTGLGLAICRMIIEQHGGKLTVSSDSNGGALFQFVLPVGGVS